MKRANFLCSGIAFKVLQDEFVDGQTRLFVVVGGRGGDGECRAWGRGVADG